MRKFIFILLHKNALRCSNILILSGVYFLLNCTMAIAAATFVTDQAAWESMVTDIEVFETISTNIGLADELSSDPVENDSSIGHILTFQSVNTGLSKSFSIETIETDPALIPSIGTDRVPFTFDDKEGGTAGPNIPSFDNALSVGDINNWEDDDWRLILLNGDSVTAFGVEIRHARFAAGETITLNLLSNNETVAIIDLSSLPDTGNDTYFIGIISDTPFDSIDFDEDPDSDDIAIADFRFAEITACPNLPVRIAGAVPVYYSSLQAAYDDAIGGKTIQSHDAVFTEDLNFNLDKSVFVEGGYDCDYTSVTGKTTHNGNMTVSNGTVTIQNGMQEVQ